MNKSKIKTLEKSLHLNEREFPSSVKIETYESVQSYKKELERRKKEGETDNEQEDSNFIFPSRIDILVCKTREDVEFYRSLKND